MLLRSQYNLNNNPVKALKDIVAKLLKKATPRKVIKQGQLNVDGIKLLEGRYFVKRGPLPISYNEVLWLTDKVKDQFLSGPSLIKVQSPIALVGDIHGQFEDLVMIFDQLQHPPQRKYLFLGDYVDRGLHSLETICLLFAYTLLYPNHLTILRGNHELLMINLQYGFKQECNQKMSDEVFDRMNDTFDCMPLAAIVDDEIFCCHGGLGPHLLRQGLVGIENIQRPLYPQGDCLVTDLLWADPSRSDQQEGFAYNYARNISHVWGSDMAKQFLETEGLKMMVRAHEAIDDGYEQHLHPLCYTVFSAPNYCNVMDNQAAVMVVIGHGPRFTFAIFTKK